MITGALIMLGGIVLGRLLPSRPGSKMPKQPKAECGCKHNLALHDPKTNECHATVTQETKWDSFGDPIKWAEVQCSCRQYTGPKPAEMYFSTPLLLPEGDSQ